MLWSRVTLERKNSDYWYWRIGKVRCIRNISQKIECERSLDNPKRWRICISYGRWFSKFIRKKLRIPRTHSETGIHRKERISAENLMAIGKSFNLKKKVTQKLGKIFGLFKKISCIVIMLNRQVQLYVPRKESYPTPLSNIDVISATYADLETAQRSEFMTIGMSIRTEICQIRGRVSTRFTLLSEIPQKGNNQSERRLTKIQTTSRPDYIWLDGRTRNGKVIGKLLFHAKDRVPEHACGKLLFQNDKSQSVWSKEKCSCIDIAGAWRNSVLYYNFGTRILSDEKIWWKLFT